MRNFKILFITMVIIIAIMSLLFLTRQDLVPTPAQAQTEQATNDVLPRTITVVGEGIVSVEPDTAQATIGVQITNPNLEEATSQAQQQMEAILTALQGQAIAEEDIRTTNFNIFVERTIGPEGQPTDELLYHVNNDVQVTVRDLSNIGPVLDAAITAGANNIYGVSFSVDDASTAMAQAREEAINDASTKAQDLAQLTGVQLGNVVRVSEVINPGVIPLASRAEAVGGGGPIVPGQLEVSVQLEVVYGMQ